MDIIQVEEKAAHAVREVALFVASVAIEGGLKQMMEYLIIHNNYSFDDTVKAIGVDKRELAWHLKTHYGVEYK